MGASGQEPGRQGDSSKVTFSEFQRLCTLLKVRTEAAALKQQLGVADTPDADDKAKAKAEQRRSY